MTEETKSNKVVCPACRGSRRVRQSEDSEGSRCREVFCDICGGLGEVSPEIAREYEEKTRQRLVE